MTLELKALTIGYARGRHGQRVVAGPLDLRLDSGSFTCLLGPNGAGKSTLIRTLTGLQPALAGEVRLAGRLLMDFKPRELARTLGLVLTQRVAVGTLPVWSLVAMGRHPHTGWMGRLTPEDEGVVEGALEAVGLAPLAWRPMSELSDGERQKAMIARALAQEPRVLILDEATAHLDLPRRVELMDLLKRLAIQRACAILLSSHDLDLSLRGADRLWLMSDGGVREGIPEDLVLDGAFEATFCQSRLAFDPWHGAFHWPRPNRGALVLQGSGLPAVWARRALERHGFSLCDRAAWTLSLESGEAGGLIPWRLEGPQSRRGCSLESMIEALLQVTDEPMPGTAPLDQEHVHAC
jgi:iron complex transport system ATP-binding protein